MLYRNIKIVILLVLLCSITYSQSWQWWWTGKTGITYSDISNNDGLRPFTPFNGTSYLKFDGVNDFMRTANDTVLDLNYAFVDSFSIYMNVAIFNTSGTNKAHTFMGKNNVYLWSYRYNSALGSMIEFYKPGYGWAEILDIGTDCDTLRRPYKLVFRKLDSTLKLFRNDSLKATINNYWYSSRGAVDDYSFAIGIDVAINNYGLSTVPAGNFFRGTMDSVSIHVWKNGVDYWRFYPMQEGAGNIVHNYGNNLPYSNTAPDTTADRTYPTTVPNAEGTTCVNHFQMGYAPAPYNVMTYAPTWYHTGTRKNPSIYFKTVNFIQRDFVGGVGEQFELYPLGLCRNGDTSWITGTFTDTVGGYRSMKFLAKVIPIVSGVSYRAENLGVGLNHDGVAIYKVSNSPNTNINERVFITGQQDKNGDSSLTVNYVCQFNGTKIDTMRTGFDNWGYAISNLGDSAVIFGGIFGTAGGVVAKCVAYWNGTVWKNIGDLSPAGAVWSFEYFEGSLYAGTSVGLYRYEGGTTWTLVASTDGAIYTMANFNGYLVLGGTFSTAGGITATGLCKYKSGVVTNVGNGTGFSGFVKHGIQMTTFTAGQRLYACGDFYEADGIDANGTIGLTAPNWDGLYIVSSAWTLNTVVINKSCFIDKNWVVHQAGYGFDMRPEEGR